MPLALPFSLSFSGWDGADNERERMEGKSGGMPPPPTRMQQAPFRNDEACEMTGGERARNIERAHPRNVADHFCTENEPASAHLNRRGETGGIVLWYSREGRGGGSETGGGDQ